MRPFSAPGPGESVRTTCPYCGVGCGLRVSRDDEGRYRIAGDQSHPANFGRLCSKGLALADVLGDEDRLREPRIGGRAADWPSALDLIARRFERAILERGPDSTAFYVSGQLLTEDYYVANKLMKGFIGSANIDTNSRLCMASSVAAHKRAFGADIVPGCYEDLEQADLVVLIGSNLAWCHPVLFQRLAAARQARPSMRIVLIDPRRTATASIADLHLAIRPDGDVALFNGLLRWLDDHGCRDAAYVERHTSGLASALAAAGTSDLSAIAARTGLSTEALSSFYRLFASRKRCVSVYSQGVNQSDRGTDNVNAILNCHLLTGRIGRPGMGPFSVTGQPNAMGGREVGGLANQLACHLSLDDPDHRRLVQDHWGSPRIAERPGRLAIDLFEAAAEGEVEALWIMATNPADSLPDTARVRQALARCPFVVVSDVSCQADTLAYADVILPAAAWGEKDGMVTNSERRMSRQRAFRAPPGSARPDWWALSQVAARLGYAEAFAYRGPDEIFREYAALSARVENGRRSFDIGALADYERNDYDAHPPTTWPAPTSGARRMRFFADGKFFTPDGRGRFVPVAERPAFETAATPRPLVLNSGRNRDQWHTMTRTAQSVRLSQHLPEPYVAVHPDDVRRHGLQAAGLVRIDSDTGSMVARLLESEDQSPGTVYAPIHWNDRQAPRSLVNRLYPAVTDPVSGQPRSKFAPVTIGPYPARWYAFAVSAQRPALPDDGYCALARAPGGWGLELAGTGPEPDPQALLSSLCATARSGQRLEIDTLSLHDNTRGQAVIAQFRGEDLLSALFVAREPVPVARRWAISWLERRCDSRERWRLLAGRDGGDQPDPGAVVCSCHGIGSNQIREAVQREGCATVDDIGKRLGAGTSCGSCRSEIETLIAREHHDEAV